MATFKISTFNCEKLFSRHAEKLTRNATRGPVKQLSSVKGDKSNASDHCAVWAEFSL